MGEGGGGVDVVVVEMHGMNVVGIVVGIER